MKPFTFQCTHQQIVSHPIPNDILEKHYQNSTLCYINDYSLESGRITNCINQHEKSSCSMNKLENLMCIGPCIVVITEE